ncbi:MAG: lysine--tRNA ligase [Erysipelotrichaceae bacterium]|nr:lysine--tRNA ligase [Erysipelotrichaceae bacterium]
MTKSQENTLMEEKLNDQQLNRRAKLDALRQQGINPFGQAFKQSHHSQQLKDLYGDKSQQELNDANIEVTVAGRIMTKRRMGKLGFMHIQDRDGQIQIVVNKAVVGDENYELFKNSDIGDIIGIKGTVVKTDTGELSVKASLYTHLTKALRPLPEKFHGLTDKEERYRRRYVDLIMNESSKQTAFMRSRILSALRQYMDSQGFVEVETPILTTLLTGASARPFITHHNTQDLDMYLRIALELPLKRLLVGGMEAVYEIGRVFRNEGMDPMHNPEFTELEAYLAYSDLEGMMDLTEGLFQYVAEKVCHKMDFTFLGHQINLKGPWKRVSMVEAIKEKTGIDFSQQMSFEEAKALAKEHDIEVENHFGYGHIVNAFFEKYVEEELIQPTFLYGHPIEISPLTRANEKDPRFVDRFELFIGTKEFCNAYTELNDPIDQLERFRNQLKERSLGNDEANDIDMDFVEALEYGMPPAGGIGYGVDRLVMLFTETETIRDIILFPTMKPQAGDPKIDRSAIKTVAAEEKKVEVDFSKVEIEPLFEDEVDFETFSKSDFRVVKIKSCEPVGKKLLKFILDDGSGTDRQILSGIHAYYEPEELIGKTAVAIVNLPTRKLMGQDSQGMLISAIHHEEGEERLNFLMLDDAIPAGAKLY